MGAVPLPEFKEGVFNSLDGGIRMEVERAVSRLHTPPCPSLNISKESIKIILDKFWKEYDISRARLIPLDIILAGS